MTPGLKLTRVPYEEPYHLNLLLQATNERVHGELEYYCNATDLTELGEQLQNFEGRSKPEIVYQLGSETGRSAHFLRLQVDVLGRRGHAAVRLRMNNRRDPPDLEVSEFSIRAEVADINRLGKLLIGFSQLRHRVLDWRVQGGELREPEPPG